MNKSDLYSQIKDSNFNARVEKAPCMGRCNLAPVVEVNHNHICNANLEKISNAIKTKDFSYKNDNFISLDDYCSNGGYDLFKKLQEGTVTFDQFIKCFSESELRGLGDWISSI